MISYGCFSLVVLLFPMVFFGFLWFSYDFLCFSLAFLFFRIVNANVPTIMRVTTSIKLTLIKVSFSFSYAWYAITPGMIIRKIHKIGSIKIIRSVFQSLFILFIIRCLTLRMSCDQRSERTDEFSVAKPSVRSVG